MKNMSRPSFAILKTAMSIVLSLSLTVGIPAGTIKAGAATTDCSKTGCAIPANPTDTSCMFNILCSKGMETWVECQSGADLVKSTVGTSSSGEPVTVLAIGLKPGTTYTYITKYRTSSGSTVIDGSTGTFTTQRKPGSTFNFGVQGDSHPERERNMFNSDLYYLTMGNVKTSNPDFYFMLGDDFSIDPLIEKNNVNDKTVEAVYKQQRKWLGNIGKSLFLVNGNHEQFAKITYDGTATCPASLAGKYRNMYFPKQFPDKFYSSNQTKLENIGLPGNYYAFTWGDALFVVIDHYLHSDIAVDNTPGKDPRTGDNQKNKDLWKVTLGDEQYVWLKKTLETSTSKYKFVFEHHVMDTGRGGVEVAGLYEWGGKNRKGVNEFAQKRPNWEMPIHDLFKKTCVTIFFHGHDHLFAHQILDGVTYQEVPTPADNTYSTFNKESYKSGDILPNAGFLNVTVSSDGVKVDYIRSFLPKDESTDKKNGQLAFTYSIGNPATDPTPQPQTQTLSASILLARPTSNSMTANIIPQVDEDFAVLYGTTSKNYPSKSNTVTAKTGVPFEVTLSGLTSDTQYFYVVQSKTSSKTAQTLEFSFHTAKPAGKSFIFDIQADPHLDEQSDPATYRQTLSNIASDKPDFLIDLGDTAMTDKLDLKTEANIKARYTLNRSYFDAACSSVPLLEVIGNHDGEAGWDYKTNPNLFKYSRQYRLAYFPNPYPNSFYSGNAVKENDRFQCDYYSYTWGDALFVVLDPYRYTAKKPGSDGWGWTLGKTQYDWLSAMLAKSKAKFKFVFIHQLVGGDDQGRGGVEFAKLYEWGGNNTDGTYGFDKQRPGWSKPLHKLFVDNKVTAIFKGHDHFYARQELDGIVYQTLPQPSHAGDDVKTASQYGYKSGKIIGGSGHLRVNVSSIKATVEFVNANSNKEVLYSYDLR